jgi:hypothetical protein
MNRSSVEAAFSSSDGIACVFSWDNDNTVSCKPVTALPANAQTRFSVAATASDFAGNTLSAPYTLSFNTALAGDITPPDATVGSPATNAVDASPRQAVRIVFSEPMAKPTAQSAFSIVSPTGFTGKFDWNGTNNEMTFTPEKSLPYNAQVRWQVGTGAKDLSGNALATALTGSFRVRDCVVYGAIQGKYNELGGTSGALGHCTTDELGTSDGVGRYNHFENGSIYYTPATSAHEVRSSIRSKWKSMGSEQSALGYPTTDHLTTLDGVGRYTHFQGGSIFYSPSTGAHSVRAGFRSYWSSIGWERSTLGYPTTSEYAVAGGTEQQFQHGRLYWDAATSAISVR